MKNTSSHIFKGQIFQIVCVNFKLKFVHVSLLHYTGQTVQFNVVSHLNKSWIDTHVALHAKGFTAVLLL